MSWMEDLEKTVSVIMALWGVIALVLGPIAFMRARKFFPERGEAITPDQLRTQLEQLDFRLRESTNVEVGRVRTSVEHSHRELAGMLAELKDDVRGAYERANEAREKSTEAMHKAEIAQERIGALDRLVIGRLDHFESLIHQLQGGQGK